MNKETKKFLHENNKLEKSLNKRNNEIYTDMIVYLRGSDISEYNQERVRKDILEMIIEGEERGDDIDEIIGSDYKSMCDEIISVFPNKTLKEKIMDFIEMTLSCICILGVISVVGNLVGNIARDENISRYSLTMGEIINALLIIVLANVVVCVICKNSFYEPKIKNKIVNFFVLWIVCMAVISYFLDFVVVKTNIIAIVVCSMVAFIINKMLSIKY